MHDRSVDVDHSCGSALLNYSRDALFAFDAGTLALILCNRAASHALHLSGVDEALPPTLDAIIETQVPGTGTLAAEQLLDRVRRGEEYSLAAPQDGSKEVLSALLHQDVGGDMVFVRLTSCTSRGTDCGLELTHDKPELRRYHTVPEQSPVPAASGRARRKSLLSRSVVPEKIWNIILDPEVENLLLASESLSAWDAFELDKATRHRPLVVFALWSLHRSDLLAHFSISEERLTAMMSLIESRYPDNPYHNRVHATDVMRNVHYLLTACPAGLFNEEQRLAMYVAAAAHDVEHGGLTNSFLCATNVRNTPYPLLYWVPIVRPSAGFPPFLVGHGFLQDQLAITYHNVSPLENMHAAALIRVMLQPSCHVLSHLSSDAFLRVRHYMKHAILCTDPATHNTHMSEWARHASVWSRNAYLARSGQLDAVYATHEACLAMLGILLKCADIMHMTQRFGQHKRWVDLLTEEFYQQGDREKALGTPVLPFMQRMRAACMPSAQVGFMTTYAMPMFTTMAETLPEMANIASAVEENLKRWSVLKAATS